MRALTRTGALRMLVALVGVLLPAGALAAATVDPTPAAPVPVDGRVGATGFGASRLVDEPSVNQTVEVTVAPSLVPPAASGASTMVGTSVPPATSTTRAGGGATAAGPPTTRAGGSGPTLPTLPSGAPVPLPPPPTGIPNIAPASSWSADYDGVRVRMRIDPPSPAAGQTVRFTIDYSSAAPCCTILLAYGDGSSYSLNHSSSCAADSAQSPGAHSATANHVYAGPGAYKALLSVIAMEDQCKSTVGPGGPPVPVIHGAQITACVGIGPGSAAQKGCSPFPDFGPDDMVSPVIDPFCQIRSDCTKASPPR